MVLHRGRRSTYTSDVGSMRAPIADLDRDDVAGAARDEDLRVRQIEVPERTADREAT
jgi:hypothetical protein